MALKYADLKVELREVKLSEMPEQALQVSPNATVPVLVLPDGSYIDESWDIVKWALAQNDPDNWLGEDGEHLLDAEMLIETNDYSFKEDLDHYKYADRHPEHSQEHYRDLCVEFIEELEDMLSENRFLLSDNISLADIGVFPFIRQFSKVDEDWFEQAQYPRVRQWLKTLIESDLFQHIFKKHDLWKQGDTAIYL